MINYCRQYYILSNSIIKKDDSIYYVLPDELSTEIKENRNIETLDPALLTFLTDKGIIAEGPYYNPFIKEDNHYNDYRLFIQLTGNCNLKCKHCFLGGSSNSKNHHTFESIKQLILHAIDLGIYNMDFTGGEIFTVDFLPDLLTFIDTLPISSILFTNLAFLSDKQLNMIINCSSIRCVITSLDYFNAEKHDSFRGVNGAFASTLHSIQYLRKAGISVTVNCMILKDNHADIDKMIGFFPAMGVSMHFDTVICKGNAAKNCDMFGFNKTAHIEDIQFIAHCIKQQGLSKNLLEYLSNDKCGVGESLLYVDKNGHFQLCPGLTEEDDKSFSLGTKIEEAVTGLSQFNLKCNNSNCKYLDCCSYGCREKAYKETGSINMPDYGVCELISLLEETDKESET